MMSGMSTGGEGRVGRGGSGVALGSIESVIDVRSFRAW